MQFGSIFIYAIFLLARMYLFNINVYFHYQTTSMPFSLWQAWNKVFVQESWYLLFILSEVNEQGTYSLVCKQLENRSPPDKLGVLFSLIKLHYTNKELRFLDLSSFGS